MKNNIKKIKYALRKGCTDLIKNESGEVNLVAILLIIIVTIGLVAIFKTQITNIINQMFDSISNAISNQ